MTKHELRKKMRSLLAAQTPENEAAESKSVCGKLVLLPAWKEAGVVLGFMPMPHELDLTEALQAAMDAGKLVYVPRVQGPTMTFYQIKSLDRANFDLSEYNIPEPLPVSPAFVPAAGQKTALVITPGLAFDAERRRLGRGKGFYDRFFEALETAKARYTAIGVCFSGQIADEVPVEPFDRKVDAVVSP
jgi:5-formyltetrahydrofolate cyclo-ligase